MSAYFIEVTKMSGMKTYFGKDLEELFYPIEKLSSEWGFASKYSAENHLSQVNVALCAYNAAVLKTEIIEI